MLFDHPVRRTASYELSDKERGESRGENQACTSHKRSVAAPKCGRNLQVSDQKTTSKFACVYATPVSVSSHCALAYHKTATATAETERPVPNGFNKSIKTWFEILLTGYLDMVMWFCLSRCGGSNADGTIFDRVQFVEQLATL